MPSLMHLPARITDEWRPASFALWVRQYRSAAAHAFPTFVSGFVWVTYDRHWRRNGCRYWRCPLSWGMIQSFGDRDTERLWNRRRVRRYEAFSKAATRKLRVLNAATELSDLRTPPGNRLEALKGDRQGQHSIRINGQYRICFGWVPGGATDVEITDYH